MAPQHYFIVLLGGLLVGFAAGMVLLAEARIAGVSGMVSSVVRQKSADALWQGFFLVGLVAGGTLLTWLDPGALPVGESAPLQLMIGAGLLLGLGARLSGGCTSGRARFGSPRSWVAVGCITVPAECLEVTGVRAGIDFHPLI